jgi:hypothetical protein
VSASGEQDHKAEDRSRLLLEAEERALRDCARSAGLPCIAFIGSHLCAPFYVLAAGGHWCWQMVPLAVEPR